MDEAYGRDASHIAKTGDFLLPLRRRRDGTPKIPAGAMVYTCFSSDFFLEEADEWRKEAWRMIGERRDLDFFIVTKRIDRFGVGLPADWGNGYSHVHICSTCENQDRASFRVPLLLKVPVVHRSIICEPLLEKIDLSPWLQGGIEEVIVGGESGRGARLCDYDWVLDLRRQCLEAGIGFIFKQTGACFRKDGHVYYLPRMLHLAQARKAGIDIRRG